MSDSNVKIANIALTKMGASRITAFTENTEEAKAVNAVYNDILDEVLSSHPWSFAQKRVVLATLSDTPIDTEDGMTTIYARPSDLIMVNMISSGTAQVKLEAEGILSDTADLKMIYTYRNTDPITYFPAFTQALATRLASEICMALTQSATKASAFLEDYENLKLPRAKSQDSKQGTPRNILQNEWTNARLAGTGYLSAVTGAETWHPA